MLPLEVDVSLGVFLKNEIKKNEYVKSGTHIQIIQNRQDCAEIIENRQPQPRYVHASDVEYFAEIRKPIVELVLTNEKYFIRTSKPSHMYAIHHNQCV